MSKKVSIEVGHGGADCGAVSGKIFEKDINLVVSLELKRQLERHGVEVLISRTTDCNDKAADFYKKALAFKPDIGIAVHANAFDGTASGFEVFNNTNNYKTKSVELCQAIYNEVKKLEQPSNRAAVIKDSPYLMSNLSCPTAYCELGFLDNPKDYTTWNTAEKQKKFAVAYAKGILKYLGIAWKEEKTTSVNASTPVATTNGTIYRVCIGAYSVKENAEAHIKGLQKQGVESFLAIYNP